MSNGVVAPSDSTALSLMHACTCTVCVRVSWSYVFQSTWFDIVTTIWSELLDTAQKLLSPASNYALYEA